MEGAQQLNRRWLSWLGWTLLAGVPTSFLVLFFAWPVLKLISLGLVEDGQFTGRGFTEMATTPGTGQVVVNTLTQAVAGTIWSVLLGLPGAHLLYRRRWPGQRIVRALITIPFVLPSVVVGIAFSSLLGEGRPLAAMSPMVAIWSALVFFNYSLVVRVVGGYWARLDTRRAETAATLGASPWRVWWTITLPALRPAIASSSSMIFLFCASAYGVVQVLGGTTYRTIESEIWLQTSYFLNLPVASALSILQLVIVSVTLLAASRLQVSTVERGQPRQFPRPSRRDLATILVTLAVVFGLLITPLVSLVDRSLRQPDGQWSLRYYHLLATDVHGALAVSVTDTVANSLRAAVDATALAVLLGICVTLVVSRRPRSPTVAGLVRGMDTAFMLPLGVSAVTVGFGFLVALNQPPFDLRSSPVLIPIAQGLVALPMVVRTVLPIVGSIDPRQREVAATLGASGGRILWTLDLAYLARGLGIAIGFAFAVSLGEFGATSFLARPEHPTLPVAIFRLVSRPGEAAHGTAMAAAVLLALLTAVVMGVAERFRPKEATGW